MTSPTPRLGLVLVEDTDTIGGAAPSLKTKVNDALTKIDKTAGVIMCTSTTRPTTDLYPGIEAYETDTRRTIRNYLGLPGDANWRVVQEDTVNNVGRGYVRAIKPWRYFGGANHAAFPSVVVLRNGTLLMVYRQGSDHSSTRDGQIRKATSTDQGHTWSGSSLVASAPTSVDLRDPCISLARDGVTLYLTYFKGTATNAGAGVFFRKSTDDGATWSAEVRVENEAVAASSAPCVELDNGTLVIPWYGRTGAEASDSVYTSKSTDGGTTWTPTRILNGAAIATPLQEPWIVMKGQTGVMAYRYGTNGSIGVSTSADNTANWSGAVAKFEGSGRPTIWWANDTTLACIYRRNVGEIGDAVIRTSKDGGANWNPMRTLEKAVDSSGIGMSYAGVDKLSNGSTVCVLGMESATNSSKIVVSYLGESGAMTPFGNVPTEEAAIKSDIDNVVFATNFEQPDGALPWPWKMIAGAATVINGEVTSTTADNVPDFPAVHTNVSNYLIEADIKHNGTQTGAGIVFRMLSSTTYMLFTLETGGTFWRLYKIVAGTTTQLVSVAAAPVFGVYQRLWVLANGNHIICGMGPVVYINFAHSAGEPGGDSSSTFSAAGWAGIKLNAQAAGSSANYCRRFVVEAR